MFVLFFGLNQNKLILYIYIQKVVVMMMVKEEKKRRREGREIKSTQHLFYQLNVELHLLN